MPNAPEPSLLDIISKLGPVFTFIAALIGAGVAVFFGRVQAKIARRQSETSERAAATARNKLRLDLFKERMVIYDLITAEMRNATSNDAWKEDATEFYRSVSSAKWLFDETVTLWIDHELMAALRDVKLARAALVSVQVDGPDAEEKGNALYDAKLRLMDQYTRRDVIFRPFLHLKDS